MSIALSLSFLVAAPFPRRDESLYRRYRNFWLRFQSVARLPEDHSIDTHHATIAIFGMGRVGTGAYDRMQQRHGNTVVGIDFDAEQVKYHLEQGRNVLRRIQA